MKPSNDNYRFYYTDGKDWIVKEFTFAECLNGDPFDVLQNEPLLKHYKMSPPVQSTGRTDKKGVEIFAGDVVFAKANCTEYIVFHGPYIHACANGEDPDCYGWYIAKNDGPEPVYGESIEESEIWLEVIGNTRQNPDFVGE